MSMEIMNPEELITTIERGDIKFNKLKELISRNNVGYINEYGNTALITACIYDKSYIALELIKTGKSKPEHINNDGNNALFFAFKHRMKDVAFELIKIKNNYKNDKNDKIKMMVELYWKMYL